MWLGVRVSVGMRVSVGVGVRACRGEGVLGVSVWV